MDIFMIFLGAFFISMLFDFDPLVLFIVAMVMFSMGVFDSDDKDISDLTEERVELVEEVKEPREQVKEIKEKNSGMTVTR